MKKTLIALAAVAATGAAMAQSSVTLYGVADAAIGKTGTDTAGAKNGTQFLASSAMNNGNSRWGVRGTEDLGGGLKAGFNFEQGLNIADGTLSQSGPGPFSRAAYVTLGGGFGEIRLGRTLNPAFFAAAAWELSGTANYSAVVTQFGAVLGGIRNSNQIAYTTPNFGGVSATIGYIPKDNNDINPGTGVNLQSKVDTNVIYRGGPLVAVLAYSKVATQEKNMHLGASYDFGGFKIAGGLIDPAGAAKGFTIGGTAMVGPVSLTLDIARDTNAKDTDYLLEAKYPLSKRTFLYAAYLNNGDSDLAAPTVTAAATATTAATTAGGGQTKTNFAIGVRHNF